MSSSSSSSSPPSSSNKSQITKESFQVLLNKMDPDLALMSVISAVSMNLDKVIEMFVCGSEIMHYREILKEMKKPLSERTYSIYELQEILKEAGWLVDLDQETADYLATTADPGLDIQVSYDDLPTSVHGLPENTGKNDPWKKD